MSAPPPKREQTGKNPGIVQNNALVNAATPMCSAVQCEVIWFANCSAIFPLESCYAHAPQGFVRLQTLHCLAESALELVPDLSCVPATALSVERFWTYLNERQGPKEGDVIIAKPDVRKATCQTIL
eukprot:1944102-Amphidinium_carterae.1